MRALEQRLAAALVLVAIIAATCYLDRGGYADNAGGGEVGLLDAVYYATVSVTTTGYGDIVPVSDSARLLTIVVVTPARVLFLILLVGTTLEVLASHSMFLHRLRRFQRRLRDHVIVCGYGVKGRSALEFLRGAGDLDQVVVIDPDPVEVDAASHDGLTGIVGSASDAETLHAAGIERARCVLVAPEHDDQAVLITLRARELAPQARIVAACREEANAELLENSGADSVIVSAAAAGRLMGLASRTPDAVALVADLLSSGDGLELEEREVGEDEIGLSLARDETFLGVIRNGRLLRLSSPEAGQLRRGDRLVYVKEKPNNGTAEAERRPFAR